MVKPKLYFFQVQVKMLLRDTPILVQPVLSEAPEALNAVKMVSASGSSFLFADYNVCASDGQRSIGVPVVGVVQAPRLGMRFDQGQQHLAATAGDGEGQHLPVAHVHAKNHLFSTGSPASFTVPTTTEESLVHLNRTRERQVADFRHRCSVDRFAEHGEDAMTCLQRDADVPSRPIHRYAQDEQVQQVGNHVQRDPKRSKIGTGEVSELEVAPRALELSTTPESVELPLVAPRTLSFTVPTSVPKIGFTFRHTGC